MLMILSLVSSSMPGHFMQDRSTCKAVQHRCLQAHALRACFMQRGIVLADMLQWEKLKAPSYGE